MHLNTEADSVILQLYLGNYVYNTGFNEQFWVHT